MDSLTPLVSLFCRNAECPAMVRPTLGYLDLNLASSAASTVAADGGAGAGCNTKTLHTIQFFFMTSETKRQVS